MTKYIEKPQKTAPIWPEQEEVADHRILSRRGLVPSMSSFSLFSLVRCSRGGRSCKSAKKKGAFNGVDFAEKPPVLKNRQKESKYSQV
jgi:hypothetical protein